MPSPGNPLGSKEKGVECIQRVLNAKVDGGIDKQAEAAVKA
ncbi:MULTISPECIES: hypothetical protein [Parageobacillus]|nr:MULTISPECIES: hypothetical protein [Parageobacillus]BDG48643.1 hypothetical protein PspKH34_32040 [Parageobacillus sp. KH3-4]